MKHAFSLVELSIVLVTLGLLIGGILAGQSLIRAAELRSVSTEYNRWTTASHTFRDKYFAIPGDFTKATDFWGAAHATPASCPAAVGTGTQTCNGNGDGLITPVPAAGQYGERPMFWQHLANAGLIEGTYNGRSGSGSTDHWTTDNAPRARLGNGLWMVSRDNSSGTAMFPVAVARHNFRMGSPVANSWPRAAVFKPEEMWNIDTKLDDGKPALGIITAPISSYTFIPDCTTSDTLTAEYELTLNSNECIFIGSTGF